MQRYYFDLATPSLRTVDDTGDMLASDALARAYAMLVLCETLRSETALCGDVVVTVRDREGPRFQARASISLEPVDAAAASAAAIRAFGSTADMRPASQDASEPVPIAGPAQREQEGRA